MRTDHQTTEPGSPWRGRSWFAATIIAGFGSLLILGFPQGSSAPEDVLAQLRRIPSATLSDAVDEVTGQRGFMEHYMRPIGFQERMAGRARTVLYGPVRDREKSGNLGPLYGVQIIDESEPGDVMVAVTNDLNITALGGLMATTAQVRGMEGVVVDGAVRDVQQIEDLKLPVFARSISPATMVGRATSVARDVPVVCGGITIEPGDYIVGDRDGVVRIPAAHVEPVIARALEMEEAEAKMIPMIHKIKSLQKVIDIFKRI